MAAKSENPADRVLRARLHETIHFPDLTERRALKLAAVPRYDADPARRRVPSRPPELGLGSAPARVTETPQLDALVPRGRRPDFAEADTHAWHYGQTDPNRHVSAMEYVRVMECYVSEILHR